MTLLATRHTFASDHLTTLSIDGPLDFTTTETLSFMEKPAGAGSKIPQTTASVNYPFNLSSRIVKLWTTVTLLTNPGRRDDGTEVTFGGACVILIGS